MDRTLRRAGTLLRHQIPVDGGVWEQDQAGRLDVDMVPGIDGASAGSPSECGGDPANGGDGLQCLATAKRLASRPRTDGGRYVGCLGTASATLRSAHCRSQPDSHFFPGVLSVRQWSGPAQRAGPP